MEEELYMEISSWNKELVVANLAFKRLFNNISIIKNGKKVDFKCVIGNRSRIFKHLENPEKNSMYKLPLIIIERTGITKNNDRLANVNNEVKYATNSKKLDYNLYTPVPVDISYEVTIVSKYQEHIDRAISNFIPFFNKDLYVRSPHPKFENIEITNQVVMEDSITEEHPSEIDPTADDVITCTCSFVFKTYLFCGNDKAKANRVVRHLSTFLSTDTIVDDEGISSTISTEISVITDTEYDGFVPTINTLKFGFYPVTLLSSYSEFIDFADSLGEPEERPYVDRFVWKINEGKTEDTYDPISDFYQEGNYYNQYDDLIMRQYSQLSSLPQMKGIDYETFR